MAVPDMAVPDMDVAVMRELSEKLIRFLENGDVPEGLFRPDAFLDLTMPTGGSRPRAPRP